MSYFGVGIYFLTLLWYITLLLCWVSVRTGHYIGKVSVIVSILFTIIIILLPKGATYHSVDAVANFYDHLFVSRFLIFSFLLVSGITGSIYCFVHVCLAPIETKKVKSFGSLN
ncbi:unnamed protein product [Diatraea saccharalis]|uniref:Uncharacterized protein n=1 Tax=Diatraea saccharalis TaxID=40085 RepID=A0A9N9R1W0_9NEOP|nr:unnamed protein product [Diatraea saccharalis]